MVCHVSLSLAGYLLNILAVSAQFLPYNGFEQSWGQVPWFNQPTPALTLSNSKWVDLSHNVQQYPASMAYNQEKPNEGDTYSYSTGYYAAGYEHPTFQQSMQESLTRRLEQPTRPPYRHLSTNDLINSPISQPRQNTNENQFLRPPIQAPSFSPRPPQSGPSPQNPIAYPNLGNKPNFQYPSYQQQINNITPYTPPVFPSESVPRPQNLSAAYSSVVNLFSQPRGPSPQNPIAYPNLGNKPNFQYPSNQQQINNITPYTPPVFPSESVPRPQNLSAAYSSVVNLFNQPQPSTNINRTQTSHNLTGQYFRPPTPQYTQNPTLYSNVPINKPIYPPQQQNLNQNQILRPTIDRFSPPDPIVTSTPGMPIPLRRQPNVVGLVPNPGTTEAYGSESTETDEEEVTTNRPHSSKKHKKKKYKHHKVPDTSEGEISTTSVSLVPNKTIDFGTSTTASPPIPVTTNPTPQWQSTSSSSIQKLLGNSQPPSTIAPKAKIPSMYQYQPYEDVPEFYELMSAQLAVTTSTLSPLTITNFNSESKPTSNLAPTPGPSAEPWDSPDVSAPMPTFNSSVPIYEEEFLTITDKPPVRPAEAGFGPQAVIIEDLTTTTTTTTARPESTTTREPSYKIAIRCKSNPSQCAGSAPRQQAVGYSGYSTVDSKDMPKMTKNPFLGNNQRRYKELEQNRNNELMSMPQNDEGALEADVNVDGKSEDGLYRDDESQFKFSPTPKRPVNAPQRNTDNGAALMNVSN